MKCKYCGVEIGNSLECHLCGHKQIGKTTCPVCSKLIYPYQEYCSNCGSPTIYRKDHTIKKVTPDTIVHSEQSHNYNTVSESYDTGIKIKTTKITRIIIVFKNDFCLGFL